MHLFNLIVKKLAFYLNVVGGFSLVSMVVVVLLDIVTRTVFGMTKGSVDLTFNGSFELVRYGLLFTMVFCMPYALNHGQVVVDLFTDSWSVKVKSRMAAFYMMFFGVFGLVMTYGLFHSASDAIVSGETTQDLMIPMQYIYYVTALGMLTLGLRGVAISYVLFFNRDGDTI